jgi:hypothetical protein
MTRLGVKHPCGVVETRDSASTWLSTAKQRKFVELTLPLNLKNALFHCSFS